MLGSFEYAVLRRKCREHGPYIVRKAARAANGRKVFGRAVDLAMYNWDNLTTPERRRDTEAAIVRHARKNVTGFWWILANWLVTALVQWLIRRWFDSHEYRDLIRHIQAKRGDYP